MLTTIVLPLLLLSGILLLPMTLAPTWLYNLPRVNPFVYVVDAERTIVRGDFGGSVVLVGIVVAIVLVVAWACGPSSGKRLTSPGTLDTCRSASSAP